MSKKLNKKQQKKLPTKSKSVTTEICLDIKVENFSLSAKGNVLFTNAKLLITNGRRYGLVSPNGHGKTSLLHHIATRSLAIPSSIDLLFCDQPVEATDVSVISVVLQPDKSAKSKESLTMTEVSDELKAIDEGDPESRARRILSGLGVTKEMQEKSTKQLSDEWRMRLSLARALFQNPTLLLLDEPTKFLDLNAVIWLNNYLQTWKKTLLIASHDQSFLNNICTDIIQIDMKKLFYYKGNFASFKKQAVQRRKEIIKEYEAQEKELKAQGQSKDKTKRPANHKDLRDQARKRVQNDDDEPAELLEKPREYIVKFRFPNPPHCPPPVLCLQDVTFSYSAGQSLLEKVSFGVDLKSRIALVGPSGIGKSTTLKLLKGELKPTKGEIKMAPRLRIGKFDHNSGTHLFPDDTPTEYLIKLFNLSQEKANKHLDMFGLDSESYEDPIRDLSDTQKACVALAEQTLSNPDILILDEPTKHLDHELIDGLVEAIKEYKGGVVLISNNETLIRETNCELWAVEKKNIRKLNGNLDDYREKVILTLGETVAYNQDSEGEQNEDEDDY